MIYQYPQPWLQRYWQQNLGQDNAGASNARMSPLPMQSPAMPAGPRNVQPWKPNGQGAAQPNAFASPAAMFGPKRRRRPGMMMGGM